MTIVCIICSDQLSTTDSIFATICGHIFHNSCLNQWILRSKSCPQCRDVVNSRKIFRLYPNGAPSPKESSAELQIKLDNSLLAQKQLDNQLKASYEEIAKINTALEKSQETEDYFRNLARRLESRQKDYEEKLKHISTENEHLKKLRNELEIEKKNVQILQGLNTAFVTTVEEVGNMLESYSDIHTVATFATALKKGLVDSENNNKKLRYKLQAVIQELAEEKKSSSALQRKLSTGIDAVMSTLRYRFASSWCCSPGSSSSGSSPTSAREGGQHLRILYAGHAEASERIIDELEEKNFQETKKNDTLQKRMNTILGVIEEESSRCKQEYLRFMVEEPLTPKPIIPSRKVEAARQQEDTISPYLKLRQSSLACTAVQFPSTSRTAEQMQNNKHTMSYGATTKGPNSATGDHSIFQRNAENCAKTEQTNSTSKLTKKESDISYDGLGGHAKFSDRFPEPARIPLKLKSEIPKLSDRHRLKRLNHSDSSSMKRWVKAKLDK